MKVWLTLVIGCLVCQQAYATSWDWSGGSYSPIITYDKALTESNIDDVEYNQTSTSKGNLIYWNGLGFSNKNYDILHRTNARRISRIQKEAQHAIGVESKKNDLDPALILAVITAESSGDPNAVSHAGAEGLMQLMPGTAERFSVLDAFDPAENIRGGATYLRVLLDRYDGDIWRAVAAYNAGEARIDRGIVPAETRAFADRVVGLWINQRMGHAK